MPAFHERDLHKSDLRNGSPYYIFSKKDARSGVLGTRCGLRKAKCNPNGKTSIASRGNKRR